MGKPTKSTKKFQKNHLKDAISRRRVGKKVQAQVKKVTDKAVERYQKEAADQHKEAQIEKKSKKAAAADGSQSWGSMSIDDFLNAEDGGFPDGEDGDENVVDNLGNTINDDFDVMEFSDDEGDSGAQDGGKDDRAAVKTSAETHKRQLDDLRNQQPEFYKYLMENDQSLLDFDMSDGEDNAEGDEDEDGMVDGDSEEGDDDDDDDEESEPVSKQSRKADAKPTHELGKEQISKWTAELEKNRSLRAMKELLVAFRSMIVAGDQEAAKAYPHLIVYRISSASVQRKLAVAAFQHAGPVFNKFLSFNPQSRNLPSASRRWKTIAPMVKSLLSNALKMYKQSTDEALLSFFLQEMPGLAPYYVVFAALSRQLFRLLLSTWGTGSDVLRVRAFANIRQLAALMPNAFLEPCLKGAYLTFVKCSKNTTVRTLPTIRFMSNCVIDVYGLNATSSYQHAFVYIRQLAIHLRNAITMRTKETYKQVYNWQFVHSLRFWGNIFVTYCHKDRDGASSPLASLIYPFVQITLGVIRLVSTSQYHPLHIHLLHTLSDVSSATDTFIPLTAYFVDILHHSPLFTRKPKPTTLKQFDMSAYIKCPKQYMHTKSYAQVVQQELQVVMLKYFATMSTSIAFPEFAVPVVVGLKAFVKKYKTSPAGKRDAQWIKTVTAIVDKVEENRRWIVQKRASSVDFAPAAMDKAVKFLADVRADETPLGKYARGVIRVEEKRAEMLRKSVIDGDDEDAGDRNGKKAKRRADDSDDGSDDEFGLAQQQDSDASEDDGNGGRDDTGEEDSEPDEPAPRSKAAPKAKAKKAAKKAKKTTVDQDDSSDDGGFFSELAGLAKVQDKEDE
ncbi:Nucleolar Complex 2 protein [Sorochytrium milnesiophthora]